MGQVIEFPLGRRVQEDSVLSSMLDHPAYRKYEVNDLVQSADENVDASNVVHVTFGS